MKIYKFPVLTIHDEFLVEEEYLDMVNEFMYSTIACELCQKYSLNGSDQESVRREKQISDKYLRTNSMKVLILFLPLEVFTEADGDEKKQKALYLKARVEELMQ